jgi:hypothetical protein
MLKHRASRLTVAVLAAVAIIVIAGSVATASNMGFKLNKALSRPVTGGGAESGNNWISVPFKNPYSGAPCTIASACYGALCTQTGLPALTTGLQDLDPSTGNTTPLTCGTATANSTAMTPGRGFRVRGNALPASIIIVGSHDPAQAITLLATSATKPDQGNLWFAVPYHTTAVTAADLCTQGGLTALRATVRTVNAAAGTGTTVTCGTATAGTLVLRLGEAARLRDSSIVAPAVKTFIPAHF